ncbi:MAG TPA: hypothetical protein V6C65_14845, partial [Allocoleopsis sp.]
MKLSKWVVLTGVGLALSLSVNLIAITNSCSQTPSTALNPQQLITDYGNALSNPTRIESFTNQLASNVTWRMAGDPDRLWYPGQYQGRDG